LSLAVQIITKISFNICVSYLTFQPALIGKIGDSLNVGASRNCQVMTWNY
jgi:hypothetical protein